jgi:hypothetical protein
VNWSTDTAVIIATGPSLSDEQLETVRQSGAKSIAVNNAWERAPWCDAAYAGDYMFFKVHVAQMKQACKGRIWTCDRAAAERHQLHYAKPANSPGLGTSRVHLNGNSGFQSINLAAIWGAKKIVVIGMDMKPAADGRLHFFGAHPKPLTQRCLFEEWRHKAGPMAIDAERLGIDIVNCTPGTALQVFRLGDLQRELTCAPS